MAVAQAIFDIFMSFKNLLPKHFPKLQKGLSFSIGYNHFDFKTIQIFQHSMSKHGRFNFSITSPLPKREYNKLSLQTKKTLLQEVFQNGLSIRQAAIKLKINNSTAKVAIRKHRRAQEKKGKQANSRTNIQIQNNAEISNDDPIVGISEIYPFYICYSPINACYTTLEQFFCDYSNWRIFG